MIGEKMTLEQRIIKTEEEFPKHFADYIEKPYGIIFYNEEDKESHDSNHAILYPENINNLESVLREITVFYLEKDIVPRINHPYKISYFEENKRIFEKCGYEITAFKDYEILTLTSKNTLIKGDNLLNIHLIKQWDERIANDIFLPIGEEYEVEVLKRSMLMSGNYVFVGYIENKAVAIIYFHVSAYDCIRFDYIVTAKEHRGKGYAREMQKAAVEYCMNNNLLNCYMWCANQISEKICQESGFRLAFKLPAGAAVYK
jgi:GNAT superfamily N-acetyltransferase